jgi:hypothetical protein
VLVNFERYDRGIRASVGNGQSLSTRSGATVQDSISVSYKSADELRSLILN